MTKPPSSQPTDSRVTGLTLHYDYPIYEDLLEGGKEGGALSIDKRSHACWTYLKQAHASLQAFGTGIDSQQLQYKVGEQVPDWNESRFEEIARSIAIRYQLESPSEFLNDHWKARAWQTAQVLGLTIDPRVWQVSPGRQRLT